MAHIIGKEKKEPQYSFMFLCRKKRIELKDDVVGS